MFGNWWTLLVYLCALPVFHVRIHISVYRFVYKWSLLERFVKSIDDDCWIAVETFGVRILLISG